MFPVMLHLHQERRGVAIWSVWDAGYQEPAHLVFRSVRGAAEYITGDEQRALRNHGLTPDAYEVWDTAVA